MLTYVPPMPTFWWVFVINGCWILSKAFFSHHWLNGHEFEQSPGVGDRQGSLACCSPWVAKSQTWLSDWIELNWVTMRASQVALVVKNPPANAGDVRDAGLILRSGRSPGERNGKPLQYSCLENPMDRGAWRATIHGVTESDTTEQLSVHAHTPTTINNTTLWIN